MDDMISREKVISELTILPEQDRLEFIGVYDLIKSLPTVETVKHAHWISFSNCDSYYSCSNCSNLFYFQKETKLNNYKYCPVCGAKMDEVMKE